MRYSFFSSRGNAPQEFSITPQLATFSCDDTLFAWRYAWHSTGISFLSLYLRMKYLYMFDETWMPGRWKGYCLYIYIYLMASKYGLARRDATGFRRTCSRELFPLCLPYSLLPPHIFAIPHNNPLSSPLSGLSLSRCRSLHLRACTLHLYMYPVLSIYSCCRFFYRPAVSFVF